MKSTYFKYLLLLLVAGLIVVGISKSSDTKDSGTRVIENKFVENPEVLYESMGLLEARVLYDEPSLFGNLKVFEYGEKIRCVMVGGVNQSCWNFINGKADGYVQNIASVLKQIDNGKRKDILVIGVGGGTLFKSVEDSTFKITGVEINPDMPVVAKRYFDLPEDLDYRIEIQDGRKFLSESDQKYDAIVLDICDVNDFTAHLWTKEFFKEVSGHLKDSEEGILIASRNVVIDDPDSEKLGSMINDSLSQYFNNIYRFELASKNAGEFEVSTFVATNRDLEYADELSMDKLSMGTDSEMATDENLFLLTRLGSTATESLAQQTLRNFGAEMLMEK